MVIASRLRATLFVPKMRQRKILRLEAAMKTLDELINKSELGWDTVQQWLAEAKTRMKFCRETKIIPHGSF